MQVQPYLYFNGHCEEALEFYRSVLNAEIMMLMRFKDSPVPTGMPLPPGSDNKVMHANFRIGESTLMASDGMCGGEAHFQGVTLSISPTTVEEAERLFAALSEGGQVQMPMTETFFTPRFGMVADRFGVSWMITVASQH